MRYVKKRNGREEVIKFDKITARIEKQSYGLHSSIDPFSLAQKVIEGIYEGIETSKIDELAAETANSMTSIHPDYSILAARIAITNLQKQTGKKFSDCIEDLYKYHVAKTGDKAPLVSKEVYDIVQANKDLLDGSIIAQRDLEYDYFGYKTLERSYLLRLNGKVRETPQFMLMRVALGIHGDDIPMVLKTYELLSKRYYTHATPTLFNSGTPYPQMSSCFLLDMHSDSIEGIYKTLAQCAQISKNAGGIGFNIHDIRAKGSYISGTNGHSNGIVPMLQVFNSTARYVDQCFHPDSILYTTNGIMQIRDISIGDSVIGESGQPEKVEKVFRESYLKDKKFYSLRTKHSFEPTVLTGEHPLKTVQLKKGQNFSVLKNRLEKGIQVPEYRSVKELNEDYLVGYDIPQFIIDQAHLSLDDCRFYGAMLRDGWIAEDGTEAALYLDPSKDDLDFYRTYLNDKLIKITESQKEGCLAFQFAPHSRFRKFPFDRSSLYNNKEKRFHPNFLNLPTNKLKAITRGLIETDSSILKGSEIYFDTTSKNLADSLRYVLLRMGVLTSGYVRNRVGQSHLKKDGSEVVNRKVSYCIRIPKAQAVIDALGLSDDVTGTFFNFFRYDNTLYSRVSKLEPTQYKEGLIYDIETEGPTHTFLTSTGTAHNGGNKRKGAFATYLEPWHADIEEFLELRRPHGKEELRTRDLFLALWIPDLFMKRVEADEDWTLMCPNECPGLSEVYGKDFEELYIKYEKAGKGRKSIKARSIWKQIITSQIESGLPYMMYKDSINKKSAQANLGTIKSSNLCTEIVQYTSPEEVAVCNLASIALPSFVQNGQFNFSKLISVTKHVTISLDKLIDKNFYPIKEARNSNLKHRPMAIGVQGLADTFALLKIPFDSEEAAKLNEKIFAHIYYGAVHASTTIAKEHGPYESYTGSPASKGKLQYDLWGVEPLKSELLNWDNLKKRVNKYGLRNSLLVGPMPTASTAQILGNNECFEPFTSLIYVRRTLAGEFEVVNKHLVRELIELGIWSKELKNKIINNQGSIQHIEEVPQDIRDRYKIAWEMSMAVVQRMAAERGPYVDQSQSMNLWLENSNANSITSMHFNAWKLGLKTGMYYLRSRNKATARKNISKEPNICTLDDKEGCLSCGS